MEFFLPCCRSRIGEQISFLTRLEGSRVSSAWKDDVVCHIEYFDGKYSVNCCRAIVLKLYVVCKIISDVICIQTLAWNDSYIDYYTRLLLVWVQYRIRGGH